MTAKSHLTWPAIRWALLPPAPSLTACTGPLDRLRTFLADPATTASADGRLQEVIPDCSLLAAPFILFRLKRLGYSACRVAPCPQGLTVSGQR